MNNKTLFSKLDAAVILALTTGMLYLWGWEYWANYYYAFGLPYSLGTLGFERQVMAGSWFLWFFLWQAVVVFLAATSMFLCIRWIFQKLANRFPSLQFYKFVRWVGSAGSTPYGKLFQYACGVLLICLCYHYSRVYIRADASRDALMRMAKPLTLTVLNSPDQKPLTLSGSTVFDLVEQRDGKLYLLTPKTANSQPKIVVVSESQVGSITVQRLATAQTTK